MVSACFTTVAVMTVKRDAVGDPLKKRGIKSNFFVIFLQRFGLRYVTVRFRQVYLLEVKTSFPIFMLQHRAEPLKLSDDKEKTIRLSGEEKAVPKVFDGQGKCFMS